MEEKKELISKISTQLDGVESYLRTLKDLEETEFNRMDLKIAEACVGTVRNWLEVYRHNLGYDREA